MSPPATGAMPTEVRFSRVRRRHPQPQISPVARRFLGARGSLRHDRNLGPHRQLASGIPNFMAGDHPPSCVNLRRCQFRARSQAQGNNLLNAPNVYWLPRRGALATTQQRLLEPEHAIRNFFQKPSPLPADCLKTADEDMRRTSATAFRCTARCPSAWRSLKMSRNSQ